MLTVKAALLAGLDLVLTGAATVTVLRAKEHLSRTVRLGFLVAIWTVLGGSVAAAALVGPGAVVGADHALQSMILWLAGLACFLEVAAVRAVADWGLLEAPARRNRVVSLAAMVALFVGLAAWTMLT